MKVTYYPCARKMRAGRKSLIREVKQTREPERALEFPVPEGINLPTLVEELAKLRTPFAVHVWINGIRIDPDESARKHTIDEGDSVVLIQDLSGDALRGLGWIVCADSEEDTEAA